ncbi:MAG: hypothetical protein A2X67_10030 [Ignavibacteria bacterium GWA2_55_11]|nr:MAG: hypothetical protein A2X67_10030 [Ignavibacteria bacterium GWA2_55_11]OGU45441.1 MAG: hypothetical protein A2X68_00640 [Ignavibacteria bacterium GWC2_56_12]OGU76552.1 MAG: hypothetical protein A3G43_04495 [Ignavibacteria bacterium RIFCSPLOWO2_12_FULL_56_21]HAV22687.1 hypothetical protein [Bacteroidota bacterium]
MGTIVHILHLEDNPHDAELVRSMLHAQGLRCRITVVDNESDYIAELGKKTYDLIISDFTIPGFSGKTALKLAHERYAEIPFVFVSGTIGEDAAIDSLVNGADDYVLKSKLTRLVPSVLRALRESEHRKERRRVERELKQSEEKFRQSEERLRNMFDTARDVICTLSTSVVITSLNTAFEHMTGWKSDEWIGKSFTAILHPDDLANTRRLFQLVVEGTTQEVFEIRVRRKDGMYVTGEANATPLKKEGNIQGVLATIRDVTDRKRLEEQLVQAQKFESLGTLASGIAHDFNNILGIIMGHASLLQMHQSDASVNPKYIESITKASQRGATLVKQLLTFARKSDVVFTPVQVNEIITEIAGLLRETFSKTISIATTLDRNLPSIVADAGQLHQVILNLCVNARDAMPKGGVLSITTAAIPGDRLSTQFRAAETRDYVEIRIADSGTGMDDATLKRIFEPFYTTKELGKGTGLGLSVVRGIVESHKGFVDVESSLGKGATFRAYFPVREWKPTEHESKRPSLEIIPGGKETILIIEDEELLRELVKTTLLSKGYVVLTAENGQEGVETFSRHRDEISVVLTDLGLPLLGGEEVCRRIRALHPNVKLIVASGFVDPKLKAEMYEAGIRRFVLKPYQAEEVLMAIRDVLDDAK